MPKSDVGESSELTVYSFLHPYYTFCNIIPLFLRGYCNLFCEKPCKFYICPCASMFCLTDLHLATQRFVISFPVRSVRSKADFWECGHQVPPPHQSAESASSCTSSADTHSSHDHNVTGDNRIWLTVAPPQKCILYHNVVGHQPEQSRQAA
jgi:hypothetical protein